MLLNISASGTFDPSLSVGQQGAADRKLASKAAEVASRLSFLGRGEQEARGKGRQGMSRWNCVTSEFLEGFPDKDGADSHLSNKEEETQGFFPLRLPQF